MTVVARLKATDARRRAAPESSPRQQLQAASAAPPPSREDQHRLRSQQGNLHLIQYQIKHKLVWRQI